MQLSKTSYAVTGLGAAPPWVVNAGIVVGEAKTLIIDTGANWLAAQTIYGYATAIRPENELIVFNCEPHFDHIGGNAYFHALGIDIYGHPAIQRTAQQFAGEIAEYNETVLNPVRKKAREAGAFYANTTIVNPNKPLMAGDILDLGGVEVEILASPGHTSINQSVYNKRDDVLFCADCIVTGYIPNLEAGDREDWHEWLASLAMIKALAPKVVMPGHGNVMRGEAVFVEIERMRRVVQQAIEMGGAPTG
ncbi:MAG: MBL fold metallo-hydrolase [Candidatus Promineifilaceae bacterium]